MMSKEALVVETDQVDVTHAIYRRGTFYTNTDLDVGQIEITQCTTHLPKTQCTCGLYKIIVKGKR